MNVALIRGVVAREPEIRTLHTGDTLASFDVTVRIEEGPAMAVPVVLPLGHDDDGPEPPVAGDEVLVAGQVRRRFFRVAGATQSRTELVATRVIAATDRRRVRRLVSSVAESIVAAGR